MNSLLAALTLLLLCQSVVPEIAVDRPIPEGYVAYPDFGVAYKVYDANVSWAEANDLCHFKGAQLAVIDSAQKLGYAMLQPFGTGVRHVGIQWADGQPKGEWVSTDMEYLLPSIPWARDEPSSDTNRLNRAMIGWKNSVDGLMSGNEHMFIGDYICEVPLPGYVKVSYKLPDGYVPYREIGVAYKVHDNKKNWNEARKICLLEGSRMAVIDTHPKLDYVLHQNPGRINDKMHVGMLKVYDQWFGADNGEPLPHIPFEGIESHSNDFNCGGLRYKILVSNACDSYPTEANFICEMPLPEPGPESPQKFGYTARPDSKTS